MVITKVEKLGDLIVITTDAYPELCPAFELRDIADGPQLVKKVKDRLRTILADPSVPEDPYIDKFTHIQTELTGLDIGEL